MGRAVARTTGYNAIKKDLHRDKVPGEGSGGPPWMLLDCSRGEPRKGRGAALRPFLRASGQECDGIPTPDR